MRDTALPNLILYLLLGPGSRSYHQNHRRWQLEIHVMYSLQLHQLAPGEQVYLHASLTPPPDRKDALTPAVGL